MSKLAQRVSKGTVTKMPRAEQWADRICTQLGTSVESIIEVGRLLVRAKADLVHGEWLRMFNDSLVPFTISTAQRLMKVAEHPQISNTAHAQLLPPSWYSLYELTKIEPKRLDAAFRDGVITPDMQRRDVKALLPPTKRQVQRAAIATEPMPLPTGPFRIIYADPPWRYEHVKTDSRDIEKNEYPTMDLDAICGLPIKEIAHKDATLFLWSTSPKLAEAIQVVDAWDFTYRTCMVWVKDKIGMGYYARQKHELLLIAAKGDPPLPAESDRPVSVIEAPRLAHSAKPELFYDLIDRMYPGFSKVELFARVARDGWAAWGNQAA